MTSVESVQTYDPLRGFGKGDLRRLEAGTHEETIANVYAHLNKEYRAMGLNLTPEQMIAHVTERVGLTDEETRSLFLEGINHSPEETNAQTLKVFLSVAYLDSALIPGALKGIARKPAAKWGGKTIIEMLSRENLDEFTYSRYMLLGAEMRFA